MKKPETLNTVTVGETRQKYRDNVKALDNILLLYRPESWKKQRKLLENGLSTKRWQSL